ncbi:MAG: hypothetical protein ACJ0PY_05515 [Flavobacteriaceae bacterium]
MSQYFSIINVRTLYTMIISVLIPIICYEYDIVYDIDLTLISIAIIFPLVFAIRGAFRRREKALEHLSKIRSSLMSIKFGFMTNEKLSKEELETGKILLINILKELTSHLQGENETRSELDNSIQSLINFTNSNPESISRAVKGKVVGYLQKVQEGIENCLAIHIHRTPISLKAYCKIFIYIFPIIYTPSIINKIGVENPQWLTFFVIILSEFILISLYNIQDDMEYPFDKQGLDDIKLEEFLIENK